MTFASGRTLARGESLTHLESFRLTGEATAAPATAGTTELTSVLSASGSYVGIPVLILVTGVAGVLRGFIANQIVTLEAQYSTDGGSSWNSVGAVTHKSEASQAGTDRLGIPGQSGVALRVPTGTVQLRGAFRWTAGGTTGAFIEDFFASLSIFKQ